MEKGKLIVIEGTDCSGKETQSRLLIERLKEDGLQVKYFSFPFYSSPTGKIVGLSYLGKPYLAEELIRKHEKEIRKRVHEKYNGYRYIDDIIEYTIEAASEELAHGWFPEGAANVDPKISSLYYVADRAYHQDYIIELLNSGINLVLDRYTYSNMAHQAGRITDKEERQAMYEWLYTLEMKMLGFVESDIKLFLHMPADYGTILRMNREEKLDELERDIHHLRLAERAYLEIAEMFGFDTIECVRHMSEEPCREDIKTLPEISEEVYDTVKKKMLVK